MTRVLVDGVEGGRLDPLDRGLQFGDGLFETVAWRAGAPRLWELHLARLYQGCDRLGLPRPDAERLLEEMTAAAGGAEATVKVIVTRGTGPRGYRPSPESRPRRIVAAFESAVAEPGAWNARLCATRLGRNPSLAGLKHLGRLEQVLAQAEWRDPGIHEGLMQDDLGRWVCGTKSNLFLRIGDRLLTPRVDECGVAGVMRRAVMYWARGQGLDVAEVHVDAATLARAEEVFVTNALIGARALATIDGRPVASGSFHQEFTTWLDALSSRR